MYYLLTGLLYIFSLLPMPVLYLISDGAAAIMYHIIKYRRPLVWKSLAYAFPEKTEQERRKIARRFYRNLTDTFIESIKMMSVSDKWIGKHFTMNAELIEEAGADGKAIQMHAGHTFNWEWANNALVQRMKMPLLAVYMPISNPALEKIFYRLRTRAGTHMLPATKMRTEFLPWRDKQYLLVLVADQNPGDPRNAYWINFLGRPAPFVKGPERTAREKDLVVLFAKVTKPKRGYYNLVMEKATGNAGALTEGELTLQFRDYLEAAIRESPDMWLWSHRRWKWKWEPDFAPYWRDKTAPPEAE